MPNNVIVETPTRYWVTAPDGWEIRYGSSTWGPAADNFGTPRWSSLVRVSGERITAIVLVTSSVTSESPGGWDSEVRGHPARVGPNVTRGGSTAGLRAIWIEDGRYLGVVSQGVDEASLRALLEGLPISDGVVTASPPGWRLMGSGSESTGQVTMLGLGEVGTRGYDPGTASVDVSVFEIPDGPADPDALRVDPVAMERDSVQLVRHDGRTAVILDSGGGNYGVETTDAEGHPVDVFGPLPPEQLLDVASSVRPIDVDDDRLVGVAMGNSSHSTGGWCRPDR